VVQAGRLAKPSAVQENLKSAWDFLDRSTRSASVSVHACARECACVCAHACSARALTPCRRYKDRAREAEIVGWVFVALTIVYFFLMCFMFKRILQVGAKRGSCGRRRMRTQRCAGLGTAASWSPHAVARMHATAAQGV
jgi:hypothetical protein